MYSFQNVQCIKDEANKNGGKISVIEVSCLFFLNICRVLMLCLPTFTEICSYKKHVVMRFCGSRGRRDSVTLSSVPPSCGQRWHYSLWLCPHCPGLEGKGGDERGYLRADPLTADLETASLLLTGRLKAAGAAGRSAVRGSPALSVVGVRGALH